jgi:DNA modification methylase
MSKRLLGELELNRIYQRDCIEGMRLLPSDSVDVIITDPPYNIKYTEWDHIEGYEKWIEDIFVEFKRISRQQIIFFAQDYTKLFETLDTPYKRFIWHREGGPRGKDVKITYEPFYWYGTKDRITYNRITEPNPYSKTDKRLKTERTIGSVWSIPNLVGRKRESVGHPTQKPIKLIDRIVRMTTNPDDIILDPFMGSGTTAVACVKNNRNFIGFETEPEYVQIANQRLESLDDTKAERNLTEGGD